MKALIPEDVTGGYYLENVRELASEFRIDPGGTFRFMLSYGALDRYGSGQWTINGKNLHLQSQAWPGRDFALVQSGRLDEKYITVRIYDPNPNILRYVAASLQRGKPGTWQAASPQGLMRFLPQTITDISLISEFSAERVSIIPIDATQNYFQFSFEPWIMEYFFKDFSLEIKKDGLQGRHPMLRGEGFFYRKRKAG